MKLLHCVFATVSVRASDIFMLNIRFKQVLQAVQELYMMRQVEQSSRQPLQHIMFHLLPSSLHHAGVASMSISSHAS